DALRSVRWDGRIYPLGKDQHRARYEGAQPLAFFCVDDSVHDRHDRFAHFRDYPLGRVLSLALSFVLGGRFLLLGNELFDRWLWGCRSTASLATVRSGRGRYRCVHVRPLGERTLRDSGAVG